MTRRSWIAGVTATAATGIGSHAEAQSQNRPYRLVYIAKAQCGADGFPHSYSAMNRVDRNLNVTLQYIQDYPTDINGWQTRPVGQRLGSYHDFRPGNRTEVSTLGREYARRYGLQVFEGEALLIAPDGRLAGRGRYNTAAPNFFNDVERITGRAPAQGQAR